jgi:hypothetical protein
LSEGNPKPLKALVQKRWCSREKFESRLLGPTGLLLSALFIIYVTDPLKPKAGLGGPPILGTSLMGHPQSS